MKSKNDCPYLYMYTGKCELNPATDWMECPSSKKRKELKAIGERWKINKLKLKG